MTVFLGIVLVLAGFVLGVFITTFFILGLALAKWKIDRKMNV